MTERLDIYDDNLNRIGVKPRADVHRDGDWHRVFHCWVVYRDVTGQDWVVLQKRAATKATFPNFLDVSAAGHYAVGESTVDGVRELEEELGLNVAFEDLTPVGRRVSSAIYNGLIDREVADVFFYVCDQPLADYHYQQEELAGLVAINVDAGLRLFSGEVDVIDALSVGIGQSVLVVRVDDFIPTQDHYFYKVLVLARRFLNGEEHLLI